MKKLAVLLFPFFCFINFLSAQVDTACHLRISLLTCSPGRELYSSFGHSALRVIDDLANTDIVYNYGTFDFNDPSFYSKFIRGKLLYFVSMENFEDFFRDYQYEQRGIKEQILNLSCTEKQRLLTALRENAKEENKYYKYDFIYDNCTTRLRDIVFKNLTSKAETRNILEKNDITFRKLIHNYLDASHQDWSKFGIDILLGTPLDKKISNNEAMFLPDYLLKGFDSTDNDHEILISGKRDILAPTLQINKRSWLAPFSVFAILFFVITLLSFMKGTRKFFSIFDFILFFVTGAFGILLLFMWFATDHPECKNNLNLGWALPFHFMIVFFIFRKDYWVRYYFLVNSVLLLALLVLWKWLPRR